MEGRLKPHYDAIIIGAGHNGLVAAAYLARVGKSVLVLERREVIGGACTTEEMWPGYRISTAAYLCSLLHPRIIEELELKKHGFEIYRRETAGFAPFEDGSYFMLFADPARTRAELERFCPRDVEAFFQFEADIERAADILEPFFFGLSPTLQQVSHAFEAGGAAHLFEPLFFGSVRQLLEARFTDERLMAVLSTDGLIGTAAGPSEPDTAYVLLHHYMGRALGSRGSWGYVRGGMGNISQALARSAESFGAEILRNCVVEKVVIQNDRAIGVALRDGREIKCSSVLSNADPIRTAGLLNDASTSAWTDSLRSWRSDGVSCKINMAVCELPSFSALPGTAPGPQHLGTVHLSPSMDFLDAAWADAKTGTPSEQPMVEMYIQTATDGSLAPEGKHILSCFTQYFPFSLAEGLSAEQAEEHYYKQVLNIIAAAAPNVPASIEAFQILPPRKLEERFGLTGGHIFHGEITPDQMFGGRAGADGPKTPIEGLYLCGSGAFPGGCVCGIPGFNAAAVVASEGRS